jgi:hypothetical protein
MLRVSAFVSHLALLAALMLPACASRFKIRSVPEGAEVRSLSGDVIGKTPIELSDDQSAKLVEDGIASFRVLASGYESRLVMADASGLRDLQVSLPKIEGSLFQSDLAQDYSKDLNAVLRDAFVLQKLMLEGKNSDFASRVETFKKNYPQMAFGYLLSAQIALLQGKKSEARASLERAKVLDPADASIEQNLKLLRGGQP